MTGKHSDDTARIILAMVICYTIVIVAMFIFGGQP